MRTVDTKTVNTKPSAIGVTTTGTAKADIMINNKIFNKKELLELYLHIPFCVKKCDYCDFLSFPAGPDSKRAYVKALVNEIRATEEKIRLRPVSSVFIGGGTPSILEPELMSQILSALKECFTLLPDVEFTIEANPGTLTRDKLQSYRSYGINRLSLGLQSTFDEDLAMLGRIHTYAEFEESFRLAREAGFANINVDLISAIPGQTRASWMENLRRIADLEPEHISAYSLIIEEGTPFYDRYEHQELELPDEDAEYEMYEDTLRYLKSRGYEQYEISNYARPGYACRHNVGYWQRSDYLGLGLGASSLISGTRFSNTSSMQEYLELSETPAKLRRDQEVLTPSEEMEEFMFLGLRMTEGVSEKEFRHCFGMDLSEVYGTVLEQYRKSGHLIHEDDRWRFSREGIHVSNWILSDFIA